MYQQHLSAAQFVARREIDKSLVDTDSRARDATRRFVRDLIDPIDARFAKGRRLTADEFEEMVARARVVIEGLSPLYFEEHSKSATRVSPKGDEHEFLFVFSAGLDERLSTVLWSNRVHLTRRAASIEYDFLGLGATNHLLERCIERNLVRWDGNFGEVRGAMARALGLAVVWRHALATGRTTNEAVALPFGDGLMLGAMLDIQNDIYTGKVRTGRDSLMNRPQPANMFNSAGREDLTCVALELRTVIDPELMTGTQMQLHDAIEALSSRNANLLRDLARGSAWRPAVLTSVPGYDECLPQILACADELAELLNDPSIAPRPTSARYMKVHEPEQDPDATPAMIL